MKKLLIWLPLGLFILFLIVFAGGLIRPESKTIPSKMVGKPMPAFALAPALPGKPGVSSASLANGQPHLVNVFASWCLPCITEAPQLDQVGCAHAGHERDRPRARAPDDRVRAAGRFRPVRHLG